MSADEKPQKTVIARTRFLVVDSEGPVCEALRRFLLSEGSPAVHVAPSAIIALRVLQDRRTPVDCVICAHRPELSGAEFLMNLRAGRWGGPPLQHISFLLMMPAKDAQVMAIADSVKVTGYILGGLGKENVRSSIVRALDPRGLTKALPNFKIAHVRAGERDLILAPFPASFGRLRSDKQQQAIQAVAVGAQRESLSGAIAAVYPGDDGKAAFVAPEVYDRFLSRLTLEAVNTMLNRAIYVEWGDGDPAAEAAAHAPNESTEPLPLFDEEPQPEEKKEEDSADRRRARSRVDRPARGLTDEDIRGVAKAFKDMGPEEFVAKFVHHQAIVLQSDSQLLAPTMREFYVSIDTLRKTFFPGVEMRGSKRAFQSLTHMLDQLMLRSLPYLPRDGLPSSLNINVHSILTQTFDNVLKTTSLENFTFEIPQPMIASHFEEFRKARDMIFANGGRIAVDQIFPDTVASLDLAEVRPHIAKLHWKGDLKSSSTEHREFVKRTLDRGIAMIMSRVDDPVALEIGQEFGIRNFQGFLIDERAGGGTS
ncbi:MAG: hypothetical protein K1X51_13750 [Rhodospirillaceae bacterium]|nr:hypothetical protein [Rhodospirillaceae bacterium]